jgi:sarcosine oxidase subunit beta
VAGYQRGLAEVGGRLEVGARVEDLLMRNGRVEGVATSVGSFSASIVVNAAGPEAGVIARHAGLDIPFISRRHELLIVRPAEPVPDALPWLIDVDRQVHLRPDGGGRALIGGFLGRDEPADPQSYARECSTDWADRVRATASEAFGLTEADCMIVDGWAGLYPGTLDYLPVLEQSLPGLITAAGFSGTGLMHAPAVGMIVADMVSGRPPRSVDLSGLGSDRFSEPGSVAETSGF